MRTGRRTPDSIWDEALRGEGVALRTHACSGGDVAVELLHLLPVLLHLPSNAMRFLFQLHVTLANTRQICSHLDDPSLAAHAIQKPAIALLHTQGSDATTPIPARMAFRKKISMPSIRYS